ncbi:MAG: polymer-forming cytoskeletal protein [Methylococcales bacterium]|nr:polymer-forming cytoskeletal protein [Methylococcales bacterium]
MALMGGKEGKKLTSKEAGATIISSGTKMKGDISITSSLHIEGEIEGTINSNNIITIGTKGKVKGEVSAKNFVVNGVFEGSVESETVEILSKGRIKGTLIYNELTVEKGGSFEGDSKRKNVPSEVKTVETSKSKPVIKGNSQVG